MEWRDVEGWKGLYQVSSLGQVRSLSRLIRSRGTGVRQIPGRVLKPGDNRGYLGVVLDDASRRVRKSIHRLVAIAFLGNPPSERSQVNHKNGVKSDNTVGNLEWVSPSENEAHAVRNGLKARGERHARAVLTIATVAAIRSGRTRGESLSRLARQYHASKRTVLDVVQGRTWRHVPGE